MNQHRRFGPEKGASNAWQQLAQECAQGAIYDSNERQPHSKCLPGTRVDLLRSLHATPEEIPDERKIVWIAGESGSGKSTVAHTLADTFRDEGRLAATFFFSRKHAKRSTFDHVFLTLAYQLGLQHHIAREIIVKAISDDPALLSSEKSRRDQLEKLVIAPLLSLALHWKYARMSMIIDALDEGTSNGIHHIKPFIVLLAALIRNLSIPIHKIFISSRFWPQIRSVMCNDELASIMQVIRLDDYDSRLDVDRFLRHSFDHMYESHDLSSVLFAEPWPTESDLLMLAERARGRFIFAATIVRFIDQDQPQDRLPLVCSILRGDVEQVWGNIDHLYSAIIDEIDLPARELGMKYLSLIVNLAEPLSLSDLRLFFGVDTYSYLLPFSAFVSLPSLASSDLVQIHHTSFRDFLQKRDQMDGYHTHQVLSSTCFRTMARLLKRDICNLQDPSLLHEEIPDFAHKRDAIPLPLRYALRYWLHHLQNSDINGEIQSPLLDFLEKRVLFAIEAYAVLGELGTGVALWRSARKFLLNSPGRSFPRKKTALALLYDSWRLTLEFFDAISCSALHVYDSALPCCPEKSQIRTTYSWLLDANTSMVVEEGLRDNWDCVTRVIHLKNEFASGVYARPFLSPDGSQVATASSTAVNVWETASGLLIASLSFATIQPHPFTCTYLVHGGPVIGFADTRAGGRLFLWHIGSETPIPIPFNEPHAKITKPRYHQFSAAFGHDSAKVAIGHATRTAADTTEFSIQVFDVITCKQLSCFSLPTQKLVRWSMSVAFCRGDTCLMVEVPGRISFFDALDGRLMGCMDYHEEQGFQYFRHFLGPDDSCLIRSTPRGPDSELAVAQMSFLPRDMSRHHERFSLPYASSWLMPPTARAHFNADEWLKSRTLGLRRSEEGEASDTMCKIGEMTPVDNDSAPIRLQALRVQHSGDLVGIKFDNEKIMAICGMRTITARWKSKEDECFGARYPDSQTIEIVDLAQLADQRSISLGIPQVHSVNHPGEGWKQVSRSDEGGFTAYRWSTKEEYLIIRSMSTNEVSRCKIVPDFPVIGRTAILAPSLGRYFAIVEDPRSPQGYRRIHVWDSSTGEHMGSTPAPFQNVDSKEYPLRFFEDDTVVVLQQFPVEGYGAHRFAVFSLEDGDIEQAGYFSSPQTGGFCKFASVNLDAVDFWWSGQDGSDILTKHFRWQRFTSTVVEVASLPRLQSPFLCHNVNFQHSPSFFRVYCLLSGASSDGNLAYAMSRVKQEGADSWVYAVDEDNDPRATYDTHSWSDLCIDADGWLRKRTRRLCWIHPRYRPRIRFSRYADLKLEISGNKVTFLHPELPGDRITIRLNTQIEYFE